MFSIKKEDKLELPKLPELPELPDLAIPKPGIRTNLMLPSPPQEIRKLPELPSLKLPETSQFSMPEEPRFMPAKLIEPKETRFSSPTTPANSDKKQIFIKIEKFQEALGYLNEIKRKIEAVDSSMRKIKETKLREENEIREIEEEMEKTKSMIDSIDKKVFSNLD